MVDEETLFILRATYKKLEEASLQLFEIRLAADVEPYHAAMLDTARNTIDECVQALGIFRE